MSRSRPTSRILLSSTVILAVLLLTTIASAEERERTGYGDTIHVIQPKPVLQKGRFDLTPRLGMTVNDAVYRNVMVEVTGHYHFTERVYAGAMGQWYGLSAFLGGPTQTYRDVNAQTQALVDAPHLNWSGGAEVGFVPLFGKFALFNRGIIFYDLSVTAGVTFNEAASIASPTVRERAVGGTMSVATRFFLNDWMALNLEVRDVLYQARLSGVSGTVLSHSVTLGAGVSFYLPTTFEYTTSRVVR